MLLFFCHDLKRTNGNKIAVDVATIAVCVNCVERLMPLIFATRQTNATSAEITPAKGAFVANEKPEHGEQLALKLFPSVFTKANKRNVRRNYTCQRCFCGKCKTRTHRATCLKTFPVRLQQIPMLRRYNAKLRCRVKLLPFHVVAIFCCQRVCRNQTCVRCRQMRLFGARYFIGMSKESSAPTKPSFFI